MDENPPQHLGWIPELCADVAEQLAAIAAGTSDRRLIFPAYRGGLPRVSEQESKILIAQWLEEHGLAYSVETPTTGVYQQTGVKALSARSDLSVYSSTSTADRVLNIELKAHNALPKSLAKDLEKLLGEALPGLWFHTLPSARKSTWLSLGNKIVLALEDKLALLARPHPHLIHFAFCVLKPKQFLAFAVDVSSTGWQERFAEQMSGVAPSAKPATGSWSSVSSTTSGQLVQLVHAPSLRPDTFLHLSTRGDSFRLRDFLPGHAVIVPVPGCTTLSELQDTHPIDERIDVKLGRQPVTDGTYWQGRVVEENRSHGLEPLPG